MDGKKQNGLRGKNLGHTARRFFRLLFSLACVVGFLTQIGMYIHLYNKHPTRIDIDTAYGTQVEIPAITICNNNRYRKSQVLRKLPEMAQLTHIHDGDVPKHLMNHSFQVDVLIEMGHQQTPLIRDMPNWDPKPDIFGAYTGTFGNCYIVNGNLTGESRISVSQRVGSQFNNVVVKMELEGQEYLSVIRDEVKAVVAIHNSFEPQPMEEKSYSVYSGEDLIILYSKYLSKSLPEPYKSRCQDYVKLHGKFEHRGPLSKKMCEYECFIAAYRRLGSFPMYHTLMYYPFPWRMLRNLTLTDEITDTLAPVYINQVWSKCSEKCPVDCEFISYDFRTQRRDVTTIRQQILNPQENKNVSVEDAKKRGLIPCYLIVQPMEYNYKIFSLHPLIQGIEVFGYFGGTLGMWLGFSLLSAPNMIMAAAQQLSDSMKRRTSITQVISSTRAR